jgi:hypothetical protein
MKKLFCLGLASVFLSGCAIREANLKTFDNQRPLTANERFALITKIKNTYFDPYSIRDAEVSEVAPSAADLMACVKSNAKNRQGGYAGRRAEVYHFDTNSQVTEGQPDTWGFCDNPQLRYAGFPEIEDLDAKRGEGLKPVVR